MNKERNQRIRKYITGLQGIKFSEWEEIKVHIDHTIEMAVSRHKKESALTVHENALLALNGEFGKFPVDLGHDYHKLSNLLNNNK